MMIALSIFFISCGKEESKNITNPSNNSDNNNDTSTLEIEKQRIVNTYQQWSDLTIIQDYEGASALIGQGCGIETDLKLLKGNWDDGKQGYYKFSNVQAELDEQGLRNGLGWAKGDLTIVDGTRILKKKFTSSCFKENNKWLICGMFFE